MQLLLGLAIAKTLQVHYIYFPVYLFKDRLLRRRYRNRVLLGAFRHLGGAQIRIVNGWTVVLCGGRIHGVHNGRRWLVHRFVRIRVLFEFLLFDHVRIVRVVVVVVHLFAGRVLRAIGHLVVVFELLKVKHLVGGIQRGQVRRE